MENLRDGLHIDGEESRLGILLSLHRQGSIAAGAVALGDFHQQMSRHVDDDRLLVGLPCQELVLVTAAGSALASHVLETVANSPHAEGELAPTALLLDADGLRPATG